MQDRDYESEGYNKGRRSMYDRDCESDYTGWSAFVVGAFIAGGVALLLAPQTGTQLRGTIRRYASRATDEVAERGREAWDTAVERGKEYMETGRQAMSEAGQSAGEYGETGKEGWDTAVEHMSEAAASAPEYGETGKQAIRTSKEAGRRGKESRNEADREGRNRYDRDYESDYTGWSVFVVGAFLGACVALVLAPPTFPYPPRFLRRYASRATDEVAERGREA